MTEDGINWSAPNYFLQSKAVNPIYGGTKRKFPPLERALRDEPILINLIRSSLALIGTSISDAPIVGVHAIRTIATRESLAYPTPEGIHQDGFRFISLHLCKKYNVLHGGGTNFIYGLTDDSSPLHEFNLSMPGDSLYINDLKYRHSVLPFGPADPSLPALRDIFVLTYGISLK